ncbi:right-handed parallel beta-helix repeat-containing protein [Thermoproteota archaeon]
MMPKIDLDKALPIALMALIVLVVLGSIFLSGNLTGLAVSEIEENLTAPVDNQTTLPTEGQTNQSAPQTFSSEPGENISEEEVEVDININETEEEPVEEPEEVVVNETIEEPPAEEIVNETVEIVNQTVEEPLEEPVNETVEEPEETVEEPPAKGEEEELEILAPPEEEPVFQTADTTIGACPYTIPSAGRYNLTSDLPCTDDGINVYVDDVIIDCDGHAITGDGDTGDLGIYIIHVDNVTVIDCNLSAFDAGVYLRNSSNVTLTGLDINDMVNRGIYTDDADPDYVISNLVINDTTIVNASVYDCIYLNAEHSTVGPNVDLSNCTQHGMFITGLDHSTITGVTIDETFQNCIYLSNGYNVTLGQNIELSNCGDGSSFANGILLNRAHGTDISGVRMNDVEDQGIMFSSSGPSDNVSIRDISINNVTDGDCIEIWGDNITIGPNTNLTNCDEAGIVMAGSDSSVISGVRINNVSTYGIYNFQHSFGLSINDTVIDTVTSEDCIYLNGENATIGPNVDLINCGDGGTFPLEDYGIYILSGSDNLNVSGATIRNVGGYGIGISNSIHNVSISNTMIDETVEDCLFMQGENWTIGPNVNVSNCGDGFNDDGIAIAGTSHNFIISGVRIINASQQGIYMGGACDNSVVRDLYIDNTGDHCMAINGLNQTVGPNVNLSNCGAEGLVVSSGSNDSVISGVSLTNVGNMGILASASDRVTINDTVIDNPGGGCIEINDIINLTIGHDVELISCNGNGIYMYDDYNNAVISGVTMTDVGGYGIFIDGVGANDVVINDTVVDNPGADCIYVHDQNVTIGPAVELSDCGHYGIRLQTGSHDSVISGVSLSVVDTYDGIYIGDADRVVITDTIVNTTSGSYYHCMRLFGDDMVIGPNVTVTNCANDGINIDEDVDNITITRSRFEHLTGSGQDGIHMGCQAEITSHMIEHNIFNDIADDGIDFDEDYCFSVTVYNNTFNAGTDIEFGDGAEYNIIYGNSFYGGDLAGDVGSQTYCVGVVGNFYADGATQGGGDCGAPAFTNPITDDIEYIGPESINVTWSAADGAEPIKYYVEWQYNSTDSFHDTFFSPNPTLASQLYTEWPTFGFENGTEYRVRITPISVSEMLGEDVTGDTVTLSGTFNLLSGDDDFDGYISTEYGGDDCHDGRADINPGVAELCNFSSFRIIDFDCDGLTGWADDGSSCSPPTLYAGDFRAGQNGTTDWNTYDDTSSISDFTIGTSYGLIRYHDPIDLNNLDLTRVAITQNLVVVNSTSGSDLEGPAQITLYNFNYVFDPVLYRDGSLCVSSICTDMDYSSGTVIFNVTGFTNYSTGANSNLQIYDESDPEGGNSILETYHQIRIFANYTKAVDNTSINNKTAGGSSTDHRGRCNLTLEFEDGTPLLTDQLMDYNEFLGRYSYDAGPYNFTLPGTYYYDITCASEDYETLMGRDGMLVIVDTTDPLAPTLYPQILMHPTNITTDPNTDVCGYFGEPYINISMVVLQGTYSYTYNIKSEYSAEDSVLGGSSVTTSYNALEGQNIVFVNWSSEIETLFTSFDYIDFANHNRTCYERYGIVSANRTGNDLRVQLSEDLDVDVPTGVSINLHDNGVPAGWFNTTVSLFAGTNRISAWGRDIVGNSGPASDDYINYPYGSSLPPQPTLWELPEVVSGNLQVTGMLDRAVLDTTNMTVVSKSGADANYTMWPDSVYTETTTLANATVVNTAAAGSEYVFIDGADEDEFKDNTSFVGFPTHDRPYWLYYNITGYSDPIPGEDLRIYLSPNLTDSVLSGTAIYLYDEPEPHGWFSVEYLASKLFESTSNEIYAVAKDRNGEGPKSDSQDVYYDITDPEFVTSDPDHDDWKYWISMPATKTYNLVDDYGINLTPHYIYWDNSTHKLWYLSDDMWSAYTDEAGIRTYLEGEGFNLTNDNISSSTITCTLAPTNQSCSVTFDINDTFGEEYFDNYTIGWYVEDIAGNVYSPTTIDNVTVELGGLMIVNLSDDGDITNWPELNVTWDVYGDVRKWDHNQFAVGTEIYPTAGWNSSMGWTNVSANETLVNKSDMNFMSSTVYYVSVRAVSIAGTPGPVNSTDGILFIDVTPPQCSGTDCVIDSGRWTNRNDQLGIIFNWTEEESDIVMYEYSVGTSCYPTSGYDSEWPRSQTPDDSLTRDNLALVDGDNYSISAKARNGNLAENFNGTWSNWQCSDGIVVDISQPYNGSLSYPTGNTTESQLLIEYTSGRDDISGVNKTQLLVATSPLAGPEQNFACTSFSAYAIDRELDVIPDNTTFAFNYTLENGTCYSFKILVHDRAGNSQQFGDPGYSLITKVDDTAPSDINSVSDEGFYTYVPHELDATWTQSSDPETGIDHYEVFVWGKHWNDSADCTQPNNCTLKYNGTSTNEGITADNINSTHNWKYYFEVRPVNGFGIRGSSTFSDGIIYVDVIPPDPVTVTAVNNDTTNSYDTESKNVTINFTGEINMHCVLMYTDRDFDITSQRCYELGGDTGQYSCINTTEGKETNTGETSTEGEGSFTWYINCKDEHGNVQNSEQNTGVTFNVDWDNPPEAEDVVIYSDRYFAESEIVLGEGVPKFYNWTSDVDDSSVSFYFLASNMDVINNTADIRVYYDNISGNYTDYNDTYMLSLISIEDTSFTLMVWSMGLDGSSVHMYALEEELFHSDLGDIACVAEVTDGDGQEDIDEVNITFTIDGVQVAHESDVVALGRMYQALLSNYSSATRDKEIGCTVTSTDGKYTNISSTSNTILNTRPEVPVLIGPTSTVLHGNETFQWWTSSDDDGDYLTYTLEFDNESTPDWDGSELAELNYSIPTLRELAGVQTAPSVYEDLMVYDDARVAMRSDIYLYNITSRIETQLTATGSIDERGPKIYKNIVLYNKDALWMYNLDTGLETFIDDKDVDYGQYDIWEEIIVYTNDSAIFLYNATSKSRIRTLPLSGNLVAIYGHVVAVADEGDLFIYDMISNKSRQVNNYVSDETIEMLDIFGEYVAVSNGTSYSLELFNLSTHEQILSLDTMSFFPRLYGGRLVYTNYTGINGMVHMIPSNTSTTISWPIDLAATGIYKDYVVLMNESDVLYTKDQTPLPTHYSTHGSDTSYIINTLLSEDSSDTGTYSWRIKVCDSTYSNNSCEYSEVFTFEIDNTAPNITIDNPEENVMTGGVVTLLTTITDNQDSESNITANYTVYYGNGTVFKSATALTPSDFDDSIDFSSLTGNETLNFSIVVEASDTEGNTRNATRNIRINPNSPRFNFSEYNGNDKVANTTVDDNFTAYNVLNSSFRITGPYPATTQRYFSAQTNATITDHVYDLLLSTVSWGDGKYTMAFTGSNPINAQADEERTLFVDKEAPELIYNISIENKTEYYANDTVYFEVKYEDTTLDNIIIRYMNESHDVINLSWNYTTNDWMDGEQTEHTPQVNLSYFIDEEYCWNSTATDNLSRINFSENCFFVNNNAPIRTADIIITDEHDTDWWENHWMEDYKAKLELADYYHDPDVDAGVDNFTVFECYTPNSENISVDLDEETGSLTIMPYQDWNGLVNLTCRVRDSYEWSDWSNHIIRNVTPANDAPLFMHQYFSSAVRALDDTITFDAATSTTPFIYSSAIYDNGSFVVAWKDCSVCADLFAQRFDVNGTAVGSTFGVTDDLNIDTNKTAMAIGADDEFIVVWEAEGYGNVDIKAQLFNSTGTEIGSAIDVASGTGDQLYPGVAYMPDGNYVVTWYDNTGGEYDVFAQIIDGSGVDQTDLIGSRINLSQNSTGDQRWPAVDALSSSFVAVWSDERSGTYEIYGRTFDSTGTPTSDDYSLLQRTNDLVYPSVNVRYDDIRHFDRFVVLATDKTTDFLYGQLFFEGMNVSDVFQVGMSDAYQMMHDADFGEGDIFYFTITSLVSFDRIIAGLRSPDLADSLSADSIAVPSLDVLHFIKVLDDDYEFRVIWLDNSTGDYDIQSRKYTNRIEDIVGIEDTLLQFNLSDYEYDVDDNTENLTWSIVSGINTTVAEVIINNTDNITKYLQITPRPDQYGVMTLTLRLSDDDGLYRETDVFVNITRDNDPPTGHTLTAPTEDQYLGGDIDVYWTAATDTDGDNITYILEYSTDGGTIWTLINDSITSNPHSWDSTSITWNDNVKLRLNASDGWNYTNYTMSYVFTVDNEIPYFTKDVYPVDGQIIAGNSTLVSINTSEDVDCTITIGEVLIDQTWDTIVHEANTSWCDAFNMTEGNYTLIFDCVDPAGNRNVSTSTFRKLSALVVYEGYSVEPILALQGQPVNITLMFSSAYELDVITVNILNETLDTEKTLITFVPYINSTNQESSNVDSYTDLGNHSIEIIKVRRAIDLLEIDIGVQLNNTFIIYESTNQTINLD